MKDELNKLLGDLDAQMTDYVEDDNGVEFNVCCIGHAATLRSVLKATDIDWGHKDCHFWIHKLPPPTLLQSVRQVSVNPQQCYVTFDSSVATYAKSIHPFDTTARLALIQDIEKKVTDLVFHRLPKPSNITFTWTSSTMAMMQWRDNVH